MLGYADNILVCIQRTRGGATLRTIQTINALKHLMMYAQDLLVKFFWGTFFELLKKLPVFFEPLRSPRRKLIEPFFHLKEY